MSAIRRSLMAQNKAITPDPPIEVVKTWNVGKPITTDVIATLYDDGSLIFDGTGDTISPVSASNSWLNVEYIGLIKSVNFKLNVQSTDLTSYFNGCSDLETIKNLPSSVLKLNMLCFNCISLRIVPRLDHLTENVNLTNAFNGCRSMTTYDSEDNIFRFPSNATVAPSVFANCESLNLGSDFMIPKAMKTLSTAFSKCSSLTTRVTFEEGSQANSITGLFTNCTALRITLQKLPTVATNIGAMYTGCTGLVESVLEVTSTVTSVASLFKGCVSLYKVSPMDLTKITNASSMFEDCLNLQELSLETPLVFGANNQNFNSTFKGCKSLESTSIVIQREVLTESYTKLAFTDCATNGWNAKVFVDVKSVANQEILANTVTEGSSVRFKVI